MCKSDSFNMDAVLLVHQKKETPYEHWNLPIINSEIHFDTLAIKNFSICMLSNLVYRNVSLGSHE